MTDKKSSLGLSEIAWERLRREQGYLYQARSLFRQDGEEELTQLLFAEHQDADDHIGVIRQFLALVEKGITPSPLILASVAAGFRTYLDAAGEKSLDQAFDLKRRQRVGHPLSHRIEQEIRGKIMYVMWCLRREALLEGKSLSIEDAASEVINRYDLPFQEDTLKKNYIEKCADEIFYKAEQALEELKMFSEKKN